MMERNLSHRVEAAFPIEQPELAARVLSELKLYLEDGRQRWQLNNDGTYTKILDDTKPAAQSELLRTLCGPSSQS